MSAIVTSKGVMPSLRCERSAILLCVIVLAHASTIYAQSVGRNGDEYTLSGRRAGNQLSPQIAMGSAGGYLVWQDNAIDGVGKSYGIAARKLGSQMEPLVPVFRVNVTINGLQENPHVALMTNGGAAFVWQGGKLGAQDIYFRTYSPAGVLKPQKDLVVNAYTNGNQSSPVITCLSNGNLAVAWCSLYQDKSVEGVYARVLTPAGSFASAPFRVNQFTANSQRSPAITTLSNGYFIVAWVSDNQGVTAFETFQHTNRAHVYARVFTKGGYPVSDEFRVNTRSNLCATPAVAQSGSRGFTIVWAERSDVGTNGWDIYARTYSAFDAPMTGAVLVNETTFSEQTGPQIAQVGDQQLIVWNSLGQDTFREGVFGRVLTAGAPSSPEFLVNTHTSGAQIQQTVASDNSGQFVVAWSGYMGESAYDLRGQRYEIEWPPPGITATANLGSAASSSGPLEAPVSVAPLPAGSSVLAGMQGGNNLRVSIANSSKGPRLSWTAEPGGIYQVQYSTNFTRWDNVGEPRTATSNSEWTPVGHSDSAGFYRVIRVQ